MNLTRKHQSNRKILQRKVVTYGKRTKTKRRREIVTFLMFFIVFMNLTRKHSSNREEIQRKVFKYGRRTKIAKKQKICYL